MRQACSISSSVASGRADQQVVANQLVEQQALLKHHPDVEATLSSVTSRRSCPSMVMRPDVGSHRRCSSVMAVDLPAPVWPTKAT